MASAVSERPLGEGRIQEYTNEFREKVFLTALSALIQAHPDWIEASLVTSAERMARMISPTSLVPAGVETRHSTVDEVAA